MGNKTCIDKVIEFRKMKMLLLVASLYLLEICQGGNPHKVKQKQHFLIEVDAEDDNETGKNRRQKSPTTDVAKIGDYQIPWLNKCSLGSKNQGTKKQLDVRGCGGWVNLACPGGCLAIHKVFQKYIFA